MISFLVGTPSLYLLLSVEGPEGPVAVESGAFSCLLSKQCFFSPFSKSLVGNSCHQSDPIKFSFFQIYRLPQVLFILPFTKSSCLILGTPCLGLASSSSALKLRGLWTAHMRAAHCGWRGDFLELFVGYGPHSSNFTTSFGRSVGFHAGSYVNVGMVCQLFHSQKKMIKTQ